MTFSQIVVVTAALLAGSGPAWAEIFKCVDAGGHITYTNQKGAGKGCATLSMDQAVSTVPAPKSAAKQPTPAGFPRVDGDTQRQRDLDRRQILEQELATEEKNLDQARKDLAGQEAIRSAKEKDAQRAQRLQPHKDNVALHGRNVEALKKEISNLK
jgi:hypothetical protein